jgi:hypothetical protein
MLFAAAHEHQINTAAAPGDEVRWNSSAEMAKRFAAFPQCKTTVLGPKPTHQSVVVAAAFGGKADTAN